MLASTAFYAPIRAMQDMVQRLVEIDTLMTDINRVMDVPEFKLTELLNEAVNVSDELSSKLTDVLKIIGDFGRMGFQESELIDISKTAQVLQNISDLDAKSSVDTLTSAMLNFNIAASDSVKIADQLNEVDNNFAISTKDLSDGLRRSASTAKTFGVEMEELVGYIAAIGSTTRESGATIGNGLKTIFSRITTMDDATGALNSVNISIKDIGGNVKPVSDILGELAGKWTSLSDEQRQNLGVTLAGRYQLSRFLALMNNWQLSVDATNTALNSQGSSMREQAKYADSLEARINRLDTAWNKLTISTGNAFLTDGIIATVETLNDLATVSSKFIDTFGVLPILFGTVGAASVLLSTRIKTLSTAFIFGSSSMTATSLATVGLSQGMTRATIATTGLKVAMRGLLASTVVGAAFVGIGIALEQLIKLYSNAKQKQQEFEESQRKNIDALTVNKKQTDNLISSYKEMSKQRENGKWDTENEKEFLEIQQQLGELYPSLISSIDATGQFHIKTTDAIDKEIKSTEKLLKLKREEIKTNALKTFEDNVDKRDGFFGLENQAKRQRDQVEELRKVGADSSLINKEEQELFRLETELSTMSQKVTDEVLKVAEAYQKLEIDPSVSRSVQNFISSLDLSKLNPTELESYAINVAKITDEMQRAYERNDTKAFDKAKESLTSYAQQFGATDVQAKSFDLTLEKVKTRSEVLSNVTYDGAEGVDALGESMEGASDEVDTVVKSYEDAISSIEELNGVMNDLNDTHSVSSESINFLMEKYPHLLQYLGDEKVLREKLSEEIQKESLIAKQSLVEKMKYNETFYTNAIKNSAEAVKAFNDHYGIDLKQFKTLAQAKQEVDNRLRKSLGAAWNDFYKDYSKSASGMKVPMGELKAEFESAPKTYWQDIAVREAQVAFNDISLGGITPIVSKAISSSGLDNPKKDKKSSGSKSTKDPITQYVSDEYQKSVDAYNLKLEESRFRQEKLTESSASYRKELSAQSTIYTSLMKLTDNEVNRLSARNVTLNRSLSSMGSFNKLSDKQKEKYNDIKKEIDDNTKSITTLKKSNLDYQNSIDTNKIGILNSELSSLSEKLNELDGAISINQKQMERMDKGSSEYYNTQNKIIAQLNKKSRSILDEKTAIESMLKSEKLSISQKEELLKKLKDLSFAFEDVQNEIYATQKALHNDIADDLTSIRDQYLDGLKKELDTLSKELEGQIDSTEKYYDSLIEKQQERLDALDEEIEKEDRLKRLREIDDQIEKAKKDKRYSYITESGEEILTYNKQQVSELEQQRNDLIQQYQREDVKKAIQDEIDRLEKAKKEKIDKLRQELDQLKLRYDDQIRLEEERWDGIIQKAQEGTLKLDEVMNGWYGTNLENLSEYVTNLQSKIQEIKDAYSSLSSISISSPNLPSSGSSSGGSSKPTTSSNPLGMSEADYNRYVWNKERYVDGINQKQAMEENQRLRDRYGIKVDNIPLEQLKKYHDGGIVGTGSNRLTQLANKLFNVKPNEEVVKSLKGELQVPPSNIPNLFTNIGNMVNSLFPKQNNLQPVGDTIILQGVTIKTDNPKQFFNDLDIYIRMNKS